MAQVFLQFTGRKESSAICLVLYYFSVSLSIPFVPCIYIKDFLDMQ